MKKSILIFALSRSPWIGGIYYRKNIIHMLLTNEDICNKYNIVVLTNKQFYDIFKIFEKNISIEICDDNIVIFAAIYRALICCFKHNVKYVFPLMPSLVLQCFGIVPVSWIADFQHCYYPEFFLPQEIKKRNRNFMKIAKAKNPLVLSSNSSLRDLKSFFNPNRLNVHVVHFSSFIDDELDIVNKMNRTAILQKYDLVSRDFCIICNQFWKHKNHKIVLEAIEMVIKKFPNLIFVFTGDFNDRRNPDYIKKIKKMFEDPVISNNVRALGFISREEQLLLIQESEFIIQPSLFEGWGTTVEDGKKIGKRMILSDIDVHKEQKNDNCFLFSKEDFHELSEIIIKLVNEGKVTIPSTDDTDKYSKSLTEVFV